MISASRLLFFVVFPTSSFYFHFLSNSNQSILILIFLIIFFRNTTCHKFFAFTSYKRRFRFLFQDEKLDSRYRFRTLLVILAVRIWRNTNAISSITRFLYSVDVPTGECTEIVRRTESYVNHFDNLRQSRSMRGS